MKIATIPAKVRCVFTALFFWVSYFSFSQGVSFGETILEKPSAYLGFGTGINSYSGVIGPRAEFVIGEKVSLFGAVGLGSWGYKFGTAILYYTDEMPFGWNFGAGYSYSTGFGAQTIKIPNEDGTVVEVFYHPVRTINPTVSYSWRIGKKFNRFVLNSGYNVRITKNTYSVASRTGSLSKANQTALNIFSPGGLVLGFSFMFGI